MCGFLFATYLVTCKIGQIDVDVIFPPDNPKKISYFRCKLFCNKDVFQNICLNYEIWIILAYRSILSKNFNVK